MLPQQQSSQSTLTPGRVFTQGCQSYFAAHPPLTASRLPSAAATCSSVLLLLQEGGGNSGAVDAVKQLRLLISCMTVAGRSPAVPGDEGFSHPSTSNLHTIDHSLVTHVGVRPGAHVVIERRHVPHPPHYWSHSLVTHVWVRPGPHVVLERRHVPVDNAHDDVARNDRGAVKQPEVRRIYGVQHSEGGVILGGPE